MTWSEVEEGQVVVFKGVSKYGLTYPQFNGLLALIDRVEPGSNYVQLKWIDRLPGGVYPMNGGYYPEDLQVVEDWDEHR